MNWDHVAGFTLGFVVGLILLRVQQVRHRATLAAHEAAVQHLRTASEVAQQRLLEASDLLKVNTEETIAIRRERLRKYNF